MILTEERTCFPRTKRRWWLLAIGYRVARVGRFALGDRRFLRFLLNLHWICWRLAYELAYTMFGRTFPNETYGVSTLLLEQYLPDGGTVIDIGCGAGRLAHLVPTGTRVLGLDRDNARLAEAHEIFHGDPSVQFRYHDLTTGLPEGVSGDVALLVGVLEHVDNGDALLRSLHAVATTLVVEVPDTEADPLNWARRHLDCPWYTDADHVREYTRELLDAQLRRTGWMPLEWVQRGAMVLAVCRQPPATSH